MDFKDYQDGAEQTDFWFDAKARLIEILINKAAKNKKCKILNVGAGTGDDLKSINKFGDVFAIDVDKNAIDLIPDDLVYEKRLADVLDLPYEDNFFDLVVAFDVLEHIEKDTQAAKEIFRVLKPDGRLVFTVPAFNVLYTDHDKKLYHFRRYNKKMIGHVLKDFQKEYLGFWFFFLFLPAALVRLCNLNVFSKKKYIKLFDRFFFRVLCIENWLISKRIKLPIGLSMCGVYSKKKYHNV